MAELSEAKRALLAQRLSARAPVTARRPDPIPARPSGPPPLSAGQAALRYEHARRADRAGYNVVHRYRLRGPFDVGRFRSALAAVVAHHEPLVTSFGPERRTLPVAEALRVTELDVDPEGFEAWARREAATRFDLDDGPLVRVAVARFAAEDHGLVLALHHVSSDAASLQQLWRDLDRAYRGEALVPHPTSYADHAAWQAARRGDDDHRFWAEHLGPGAEAVVLPLAPPEPAEPDGYLTRPVAVTDAELRAAGLRSVPFFVAVAAALLQRYTDGDEVTLGVVASTRDHPDVEDLVGYFLTVLPLRVPVDPQGSAAALTRSVEATLAAGLAHRHVPYAEIVSQRRQAGQAEVDPARVLFVADEAHQPRLDGCSVEGGLVHNGVAVADLTLFARPAGPGFEVSAEWDGSRYRHDDIAALLDAFAAMAERAASRPGSRWDIGPDQGWGEGDGSGSGRDEAGTAPTLRAELVPVPALIEQAARRRPDAPAVRSGDRRLDHAALAQRAAAVARGLVRAGVAPGDRVAVLLPRSVDLVAAVLGVHRAGAAYVPLDPSYPDQRIERVVALAAPVRAVTDQAGASRLPVASSTVDELVGAAGPPVDDWALPTVGLDHEAYVMFTSGSTGTPRGVVVTHRQLAASTLARLEHYQDPVGSFLLVSSFGFDSSVAGLFWTLVTGGELVVPTEDEVHDVDALAELVEGVGVTHTLMVPTLYGALLARAGTRLASLRLAVVAGEACPASLVLSHARLLAGTVLSNEYGPTEATVWATAHRCQAGESPVPIGRAVPGATVRVADRWLRPRPPGAAGELVVGGLGVTAGYLDDPEATAARFGRDPRGGERLYRTGDLVRRRADGALLFLGRIDRQLSVGGVRLEPEEVEAAVLDLAGVTGCVVRAERQIDADPLGVLGDLPAAQAAAVLAGAATDADPARGLLDRLAATGVGREVLVAYVEGHGVDGATVSAAVARRLPATWVPSVVEVVDHLARTEHGKVDQSALGAPVRWRRAAAGPPVEAGAAGDDRPLVEVLVGAWRRVLDDPSADADSDFFDRGGDSLRAVELVLALEEHLGSRVSISALVQGRTPRRLAALLGSPAIGPEPGAGAPRPRWLVPLRSGTGRPLVVLPPGGGHLIAFDRFVQALDPTLAVVGFDLPGFDRDEDLPPSVEALAEQYLAELRELQPQGPYRFIGWSMGGVTALELARRLRADGDEVELLAMIDTLVPGLQRAGRARAYLELARQRDVAGIADKLRAMVRNRVALKAAEVRGRVAAVRGQRLSPAERDTWLTIKVDEIVERYQPRPYDGRVVFFAARGTYAWRTTEPWQALLPGLEVVAVDAPHDGAAGLMRGPSADEIAAAVAARLT